MYNSSNLKIKDKAWRRVGASPIPSNYVCRFAASSGLFLKNISLCETTNEQQSDARMCVV